MTCKAWDSCCCNGLPRLLRRREGQEGKERKLGKAGKEPDELTGVNTVNTSPEDSNESHTSGFLSRPEACPIEEEAVVMRFANGDKERLISSNVELSNEELAWLKALRKEAERQQKAFFPSVAVAAVRFLGDARGDVEQALKDMEENQRWRASYFPKPLRDTELLPDLAHGAVYFCGRDVALRPALVMRAGRVPFSWDPQRFARLFVFCVEYFLRYMAVPGRVENICVIIDLNDLSYRHMAIPALMELKDVFTNQNAGRVFRFYVCNMPFLVRALVNVVEAAMTERARQKICFVSDVAQLKDDFALNQLEKDLGGTRELADSFFPFPLPPGPFTAGSTDSNEEAVGGLHQILTQVGVRGRLWDPAQSRESNHRVEYASTAREFLRQNGLEHLLDAEHRTKCAGEARRQQDEPVDLSPEEVSLRCIFSCEPLLKLGCQIRK